MKSAGAQLLPVVRRCRAGCQMYTVLDPTHCWDELHPRSHFCNHKEKKVSTLGRQEFNHYSKIFAHGVFSLVLRDGWNAEHFALCFKEDLGQWQKLSFKDFSGLWEWLGLKDCAFKHIDYPVKSITFLVLIGPSPMNQELCWVILHLHYILVTCVDLKDSSGFLWPQSALVLDGCSNSSAWFSLCLSIVQGNICNAQEDAGVIGTILNVGQIFRPLCQKQYLSEEPKAQAACMIAAILLLRARSCFGIRICHCYSNLLSPKHGNKGI